MIRLGFASHLPRVQRRNLAVLTAGLAALLTVGVAVPAQAAPIKHEIQKISKASYVTGEVFASCRITTTGGTCTIAKAESITRTVQLSLGVSREVVSASLGFSSAKSVSTTVSCSSPALKAGQVWKARALGSTYTYKVKKLQAYKPRIGPLKWRTVDTSATLKAYNPYASDISCGL